MSNFDLQYEASTARFKALWMTVLFLVGLGLQSAFAQSMCGVDEDVYQLRGDETKIYMASNPEDEHAFWILSLPGDRDYDPDGALYFIEYEDGTAALIGNIVNQSVATQKFKVEMMFNSGLDLAHATASDIEPKNDNVSAAQSLVDQWMFYTFSSAKLVGMGDFEGTEYDLTHKYTKYAFQKGFGANDKNLNEGGSVWFEYEEGNEDAIGDVNVDLEEIDFFYHAIFGEFDKVTPESCDGANDGTLAFNWLMGEGDLDVHLFNSADEEITANIEWKPELGCFEATGLAPGCYYLTAQDANECTAAITIDEQHDGTPICVTAGATTEELMIWPRGVDNASCGESDGSIEVSTVMGGLAPYTLTVYDGHMSAVVSTHADLTSDDFPFTIPGLAGGDYIIKASDASDCNPGGDVTMNLPIKSGTEIPLTCLDPTITSECHSRTNGSIEFTCKNESDWTFQWYCKHDDNNDGVWEEGESISPLIGETGINLMDRPGGEYMLKAYSNSDCFDDMDWCFVIPTVYAPHVTLAANEPTCPEAGDGSITATVSQNTDVSYLWTNVETGLQVGIEKDLKDVFAGTYKVVVTDNSTCGFVTSATSEIVDPLDHQPMAEVKIKADDDCATLCSEGLIDLYVSCPDGCFDLAFLWQEVDAAGNPIRTLRPTEDQGFLDRTIPVVPGKVVGQYDEDFDYLYGWFDVDKDGVFDESATDAFLTDGLTAGSDGLFEGGEQVRFTNGIYWVDLGEGSGLAPNGLYDVDADGAASGYYREELLDVDGDGLFDCIDLNGNGYCDNDDIKSTHYDDGLRPGTYQVTISSNTNSECIEDEVIKNIVIGKTNAAPSIVDHEMLTMDCNDANLGVIMLDPHGGNECGYEVVWSSDVTFNGGGTISEDGLTVTGLRAGTYKATISDACTTGCETSSEFTYVITDTDKLEITTTEVQPVCGMDGSIAVSTISRGEDTGDYGYTVEWYTAAGEALHIDSSPIMGMSFDDASLTNSSGVVADAGDQVISKAIGSYMMAGTYTIIVKSTGGTCESSDTVEVTLTAPVVPADLTVTTVEAGALGCVGDTYSSTATGAGGEAAYTYKWFEWEEAVTVDDHGMFVCPSATSTPAGANPTEADAMDTAGDGTAWKLLAESTATVTGLEPGKIYIVRAADASGCTADAFSTCIYSPALSAVTLTAGAAVNTPTCVDQKDGTIDVSNVTSEGCPGLLTYTIALEGTGNVFETNNTGIFDKLAAAKYDITINDACDCSDPITKTEEVLEGGSFEVRASFTALGICDTDGLTSVSLESNIDGAGWTALDASFTIDFDGDGADDAGSFPMDLGPGTYSILAEDFNFDHSLAGCNSTTYQWTIADPVDYAALECKIEDTDETCAGADDGTVRISEVWGGSGNVLAKIQVVDPSADIDGDGNTDAALPTPTGFALAGDAAAADPYNAAHWIDYTVHPDWFEMAVTTGDTTLSMLDAATFRICKYDFVDNTGTVAAPTFPTAGTECVAPVYYKFAVAGGGSAATPTAIGDEVNACAAAGTGTYTATVSHSGAGATADLHWSIRMDGTNDEVASGDLLGSAAAPTAANLTLAGLAPGDYDLVVTDKVACAVERIVDNFTICYTDFAVTMVDVTQDDCTTDPANEGAVMIAYDYASTCGGAAPTAANFTWTLNDAAVVIPAADITFAAGEITISNLAPGKYDGVFTISGCTYSFGDYEIKDPVDVSDVMGTVTKTDESCEWSCDGTLTVTPNSGVGPYTISIACADGAGDCDYTGNAFPMSQAGVSSYTFEDLCAGDYTVTITDASNCNNDYTSAVITIAPGGVATEMTGPTAVTVAPHCASPTDFHGDISITGLAGGSGVADFKTELVNAAGTVVATVNGDANPGFLDVVPGTYTLRFSDGSTCNTDPADVTVIVEGFTLTVTDPDKQEPLCNSNNVIDGLEINGYGSISMVGAVSTTGGTAVTLTYEYKLNGVTQNDANGDLSTEAGGTGGAAAPTEDASFDFVTAGLWTVDVTATIAGGCTVTQTVECTVAEPTEATVSVERQTDGSYVALSDNLDGTIDYRWDRVTAPAGTIYFGNPLVAVPSDNPELMVVANNGVCMTSHTFTPPGARPSAAAPSMVASPNPSALGSEVTLTSDTEFNSGEEFTVEAFNLMGTSLGNPSFYVVPRTSEVVVNTQSISTDGSYILRVTSDQRSYAPVKVLLLK